MTPLLGEQYDEWDVRECKTWCVETPGGKYLFKLATIEEAEHLETALSGLYFENAMLSFLANRGCSLSPRVYADKNNNTVVQVQKGEQVLLVRLLSYTEGQILIKLTSPPLELFGGLGVAVGTINLIMRDFDPDTFAVGCKADCGEGALFDGWIWNLDLAKKALSIFLPETAKYSNTRKELVDSFIHIYDSLAQTISGLREQYIHSDCHPMNVCISNSNTIAGIIDFGDVVKCKTVNELATCAAFAMLEPNQMSWEIAKERALAIVAGYHSVLPLTAPEVEVLFSLMVMKICVNACHCDYRPEEDKRFIKEKYYWPFLTRLASDIPNGVTPLARFDDFTAALRERLSFNRGKPIS
eukprot:CAMPEP_0175125454 /NCGR_PEP_ID=MMETSP0087-20121206/3323_1 /TAXON_ID=136419 /ORGANISM="Unknown Unknown, Strain D1" /LENGTH=354 /DNA_ID=CAMNT_0016407289 /DNA_START=228 /DNA_END=1292 /DNA_ORIENTATION=-